MVDAKKLETLIFSLKCSNEVGGGRKCIREKCPYFFTCKEDEKQAFMEKYPNAEFPDDFWEGCDFEGMTNDAIKILEGLLQSIIEKGGEIEDGKLEGCPDRT